jgi:hypothetical protein
MALPALPQTRTFDGPIGTVHKEIRTFLNALKNIKQLSGKELSITFTSADVAGSVIKRVLTGLGYPPTGFYIFRGHNGAGLIESSAPLTETDRTVLYLRATVAGTYSIWVF